MSQEHEGLPIALARDVSDWAIETLGYLPKAYWVDSSYAIYYVKLDTDALLFSLRWGVGFTDDMLIEIRPEYFR